MNPAVIVPWRSNGCPHRAAAWEHVRKTWTDRGWPLFTADDGGTPFGRGPSINQAAAVALELGHDVLVIADADVVVPDRQVLDAIDMAMAADGLVVAFDRYCYLSEHGTRLVLAGERRRWWEHVEWALSGDRRSVSACIALNAATWRAVGGFPGLRGWGAEDICLEVACATLAGPTRYVHGDAHHLFHPVEPHRPQSNFDLLDRYLAAAGDPNAMRQLLDEARCGA